MNAKYFMLIILVGFFSLTSVKAQNLLDFFPDITINESNDPASGYFILGTKKFSDPTGSNYIAIIDNYGTPVYFRLQAGKAAGISTLLQDHLIFNEGDPKVFHVYDTMFNVVDTLNTKGYKIDGHDFCIDEQGHVLLLGSENITVDLTEYGGFVDATVRDKVVQEFDENGDTLYTWKAFDHFEITDANLESPYVDLTASTVDYLHANAICFDSDTSFLLSCRHFDEITKIDRRTGDIIWRLGGKNNVFTFTNDTLQFSHPHTIRKLENGNILLFDNGNTHYQQVTSIVEYELDEINLTATLVKRIGHTPPVFADHGGGEEQLENGNYLVYWGEESPSFTEYHPDGSVALEMDFSTHSFSNRVAKSSWNHRIFVTETDSVSFGMWDGYQESPYLLTLHNNTDSILTLSGYSTHSSYFTIQESFPIEIPANGDKVITIIYYPDGAQTGFIQDLITIIAEYPDILFAQQVYVEGKKEDTQAPTVTIMPDSVNVPRDAVASLSFTEAVRNIDGSELNYQNVADIVVFKINNSVGQDVAFSASINTEKTLISVVPDDSLLIDQTYYVGIGAVVEDYSGNSIVAADDKFSTGSTITSLRKEFDAPGITVFPNPSEGKFILKTSYSDQKTIQVYSVTGVLVLSLEDIYRPEIEIDLSDQYSGLYLVIVKGKDGQLVGKSRVIKIKD